MLITAENIEGLKSIKRTKNNLGEAETWLYLVAFNNKVLSGPIEYIDSKLELEVESYCFAVYNNEEEFNSDKCEDGECKLIVPFMSFIENLTTENDNDLYKAAHKLFNEGTHDTVLEGLKGLSYEVVSNDCEYCSKRMI